MGLIYSEGGIREGHGNGGYTLKDTGQEDLKLARSS